jgi:3-dehydroquinate dehydratase II
VKNRVEVLHGVNFDVLERRDPDVYGGFSLPDLEVRIQRFARELGFEVSFTQTNHEGEFCEALHKASEGADGLVLNPGAWTHYSYAIRDALELTGLPAVEVHISAVSEREDFRRDSVIRDLCVGTVEGKGVDGYREALELLKGRLAQ